MRVALFGGSFDPPHRGHVALARLARERFALDRVIVAPVGAQPLKQGTTPSSFEDRVAMARLAFAGVPGVEISLLDAPRADGRSNYTVDTVEALRRQLNPDDPLFCILGADSLLGIRKWRRPADLLLACNFIVGARPGIELSDAEAAMPETIEARLAPTELPATRLLELSARDGRRSRLYLLTDFSEDTSSSEIRDELRDGGDPANSLCPAVVEYIWAHGLYRHL
jgi:nicotinate-nucleotide adenylyltransferase